MAENVALGGRGALPARPARRLSLGWVGLVPFFLYSLLFIVLPTTYLVIGSLEKDGQLSLENYQDLGTGIIPQAIFNNGTNVPMKVPTSEMTIELVIERM